MNGEQARALRKMKQEAVKEVQPAMESAVQYTRLVEERLMRITQRHEFDIRALKTENLDLSQRMQTAMSMPALTFWGRIRWMLTGK